MILLLTTIVVLLVSIYLSVKYYLRKKTEQTIKLFLKLYDPNWKIQSRSEILKDLTHSDFDVLIIGGGSSGVGCALDAATRGLKVGLIEADDFGSGTSSKSTKLLHGGIRYLDKAFNDLDLTQFQLVSDALEERKIVMNACPYLSKTIEIMFPIYKKILVFYYYFGFKIYDWMSGSQSLGPSRFLSREETIQSFNKIRKDKLVGSVVYKDGQFYDSKYCVMIALTAAYFGASVLNHCKFKKFIKENGKIQGVIAFDKINKKEISIKSKVVLNTTGQFADEIRQLAENNANKILEQSSGTHIVVSKEFGPENMGFVDPNTADGRIAFSLPFKGKLLMGGTDIKYREESFVEPNEEDLKFLMHEIDFYTNRNTFITKNDVSSVWTGIRPLIKDNSKESTEKLVRKHTILVDENGLITLTGGKWTIYRQMAEQAIDVVISIYKFKTKRKCVTRNIKLLGAQEYSEKTINDIKTKLQVSDSVAEHLATSYGTRSFLIFNYIKENVTCLVNDYPFLKEEIIYQMDYEMAVKISDVLFNRLMISYIDVRTAFRLIKTVGGIMKIHYNWSDDYYKEQCKEAKEFLNTTGLSLLNTKETV